MRIRVSRELIWKVSPSTSRVALPVNASPCDRGDTRAWCLRRSTFASGTFTCERSSRRQSPAAGRAPQLRAWPSGAQRARIEYGAAGRVQAHQCLGKLLLGIVRLQTLLPVSRVKRLDLDCDAMRVLDSVPRPIMARTLEGVCDRAFLSSAKLPTSRRAAC